MSFQKETITLGLFIVLLCDIPTRVEARSVYAIPQHAGSSLNVYDVLEGIQEGQLEYRATYSLKYASAADVVIDTRSDILFVTFENWNKIELINARTFLSEGEVTADDASDLAGLELAYIDPNTTLLYTVDRGTNKLFVYDWDADECNFGQI